LENKPTIESVSSMIALWREQGGRRLSSSLWQQISVLKRDHSITELSRATGISSQYLHKRLGKRRGGFVEVKMAVPQAGEVASSFQPGMMEIKRPDGTEIRVRFSNGEAVELLRRCFK